MPGTCEITTPSVPSYVKTGLFHFMCEMHSIKTIAVNPTNYISTPVQLWLIQSLNDTLYHDDINTKFTLINKHINEGNEKSVQYVGDICIARKKITDHKRRFQGFKFSWFLYFPVEETQSLEKRNQPQNVPLSNCKTFFLQSLKGKWDLQDLLSFCPPFMLPSN